MSGALAQLPDSTRVTRIAGTAQAGCVAVGQAHADLGAGGSALAPATGAFGKVTAGATIDLAGLAGSLDGALQTVAAAMPTGVLEQVEGIDRAYQQATDLVGGNPLLGLLPEGGALRDVVRQITAEAVALFEARVVDLAEHLLGKDEIAALLDGFALIEGLRTDYPAHAHQLAGYLRATLLGFDPGVLAPLQAHLAVAFELVGELDADRLAAVTGPVHDAAAAAAAAVSGAVEELDPAVDAGYQRLAAALDAVTVVVGAAGSALRPLYQGVSTASAALDPDRLMARYLALLESVQLTEHELVDDVLDSTIGLLDDLVAKVQAAASPDEIVAGVRRLGAGVHAAIAGSAIGEARDQIIGFLGGIRDTVAAVPLGAVQQALRGMLERVGAEISGLALGDLADQIEAGFGQLTQAAVGAAQEAAGLVTDALTGLLDEIDALPAGELVTELQGAVARLGGVVDQLHSAASGLIDDLKTQLDRLTELSFTPVADEVLGEIDELRDRLRAMNPDALSEESKFALRAALAVLQALDVEDKVVNALGTAYRELDGQVRTVLDDIAAGLQRVRRSLDELRPDAVLTPVTGGLSKLRSAVDSVDAGALTSGLRGELGRLDGWLTTLQPGRVLGPLQGVYDAGVAGLHRLDPDAWGAPLAALHQNLADLADRLDLAPVFAELNDRRQDLIDLVRDSLSLTVTQADLPEPLNGWFARVLPLVTGVGDLLTLDPGAGMRELSRRLNEGFSPSALYQPLDQVFDAALGAVHAVPAADLAAAATQLRDGIVNGLDALEPDGLVTGLRSAHRRLVEAAPTTVLPGLDGVHGLRAAFHAKVDIAVGTPAGQVALVDARFDAVAALLDGGVTGSAVHDLGQQQEVALTALRNAVDQLAGSSALGAAQQSFGRLHDAVNGLVPPQLPRTGPISADQVIAACEHWRPGRRAVDLDNRLTAFLTGLAPAATALDDAFDTFTDDLRSAAALIDPLALDPAIAEIFDAVRAQVDALDPGELLTELRTEVYLPVAKALEALDPAILGARLDLAYQAARTGVMRELTGLVDNVTRALDTHLAAARKAVDGLLGQLQQTLTAATSDLQGVVEQVADLAFGGIVERLRTVLDNLATSFDTELRRIKQGFDAMLAAAPIGSPAASSGAGSTG